MNKKKFIEYMIEANRKAKKYKFYINESLMIPEDGIPLEVYDLNNNYKNRIMLSDAEVELYTEPVEDTGRVDELEDYYIRHHVN